MKLLIKTLIIFFIFCTSGYSWDFDDLLPDTIKKQSHKFQKYKKSIKRFVDKGKRPPPEVERQAKKKYHKHHKKSKPDTVVVKHEHTPKNDTVHVVHHQPPRDTTTKDPAKNFIFSDNDITFRMVDGKMTDVIYTDYNDDE